MKARERCQRRMAEGLERRKGQQVEAWTCPPSDVPPGKIVEDGCGTRHRTRAAAERCAKHWTRRGRRPVPGLRGGGPDAILPAVPVRIDHRTRQRLPPPTHAVPEAEATNNTADTLAAITRRTRQQRTCRCGHSARRSNCGKVSVLWGSGTWIRGGPVSGWAAEPARRRHRPRRRTGAMAAQSSIMEISVTEP